MYDYLIVGSGLFGSVCAHELTQKGYKVLVIDKRSHIGGNIYTEELEGIQVHKYGAHIFHTSEKWVWEYLNQFATFNSYINQVIAKYHGKTYNLPFNMNTFTQIWPEIKTVEDAKRKIEEDKKSYSIDNPKNLEEQAISLVGPTIYEKLIKGYTSKQWGKPCDKLPPSIIKRIPVRFTYDNNYFNDTYQGIPIGGYTNIIKKLLEGSDVRLNIDFKKEKNNLKKEAKRIIYTGPIDEYYDYIYGNLEFRTVYFETEILNQKDYQGNAVINYTDIETPYTRIIEHKYFEFGTQPKTIISKEYSKEWELGDEPYYPVNDERNTSIYKKYLELSLKEENIFFGGRLGTYQYNDMDDTIIAAFLLLKRV